MQMGWSRMVVLYGPSALAVTRVRAHVRLLTRYRSLGFYLERLDSIRVPSSREAQKIAGNLGIPLPLHVLTTDPMARRRGADVLAHQWTGPIPPDAIAYLTDDVYVCVPEFAFVQLCCGAERENRLVVGSELASRYAINPSGRQGLIARPPLMTPMSVKEFVTQIPRAPGTAHALEAAPHLACNARSPKEVELWLLLHLPRTFGGRGIADMELNKEIHLNDDARTVAKRAFLYADIFLILCNTDLEYDANDNHLTKQANESDKRRANALRIMDIDLITLTNGQLHDWKSFDTIARQVEELTGTVHRYTSKATHARQQRLWRRLLFGIRSHGKTEVVEMSLPDRMKRTSALDSY